MTARYLTIILALRWIPLGVVFSGESTPARVRVAVLDLQSPDAVPWLGMAVREAVAAKLAGVDEIDLLERERMDLVLMAAPDEKEPPTLSRLGVSFLLTGSVQLLGPWSDPASQLRLSCRLTAAETARLQGDAAFVLDGTVGSLFATESALAERIAHAVGYTAPQPAVTYREEKNRTAWRLFGEGLHALRKAQKHLGIFAVTSASSPQTIPAEQRAAALPDLQTAVERFRQAQAANEGAFFARTHHYEWQARTLLARAQPDESASKLVREATVKQFRQDAAAAAPAFFDLGRALEVNEDWQGALDAYGQYIRWVSEKYRSVLWRRAVAWHPFSSSQVPGRWPPVFERNARFTVDGDRLFYLEPNGKTPGAIVCLDRLTGQERWRNEEMVRRIACTSILCKEHDVPMRRGWVESVPGPAMVARDNRLVYVGDSELAVLDQRTGRVQRRIQHNLPYPDRPALPMTSDETQIWILPQSEILLLGRALSIDSPVRNDSKRISTAIDLQTGNTLWTHDRIPYGVWHETVLYWGGEAQYRDLKTGQVVKAPFPPAVETYMHQEAILASRRRPNDAVFFGPIQTGPVRNLSVVEGKTVSASSPEAILIRSGTDRSRLFFPNPKDIRSSVLNERTYLMWDLQSQRWRRLQVPRALSIRLAALSGNFDRLLESKGYRYWFAGLSGAYLWFWNDSRSEEQEIFSLEGDLVARKRLGGAGARYIVSPDESYVMLYADRLQRAKLVPPHQGSYTETQAHLRRAACQLALGNPEGCIEETTHATQENALHNQANWLAGQAYARMGKRLEALNAYHAAWRASAPGHAIHAKAWQAIRRLLPVHLSTEPFQLQAEQHGTRIDEVTVLADIGVLQIARNDTERHVDFYRVKDGSLLCRLPGPARCFAGEYLGDGNFLQGGPYWEEADTSVFNCLTGKTTASVKHDVDRQRLHSIHSLSLSRAYADGGVLFWTLTPKTDAKTDQLVVTDANTGARLWGTPFPVFGAGSSEVEYLENSIVALCNQRSSSRDAGAKNMILAAWDARSGTPRFRHDYRLGQPGPAGTMPPYRLVDIWQQAGLQKQTWNGLLVMQDFYDKTVALDPKTGDLFPFPSELAELGRIDTGLRGEERLAVLKNPSAYASAHAPRGWLGEQGASPYLHNRMLYDAAGQRIGPAQPFCGYDAWPYSAGAFLMFTDNDHFLAVRQDDYYRFFGLDTHGRRVSAETTPRTQTE